MIFIALIFLVFASLALWGLSHLRNKTYRLVGYTLVILIGLYLAATAMVLMVGLKDG
jgi:hypothetical protein